MIKNSDFHLGIELIDDPSWMGGTLYLRNLVACLNRLPDSERPNITLLGSSASVAKCQGQFNQTNIIQLAGIDLFSRICRRLGFVPPLKRKSIDAVYPGFGTSIPGAKTINWIPDFQHRHLPDLFSEKEFHEREASISALAKKSGTVVLSSEDAISDFKRFFPDHKAAPFVWSFHSIVDLSRKPNKEQILKTYALPEKYLYLPNQFWVHKDHSTAFEALHILKNRYKLPAHLVCTGSFEDYRDKENFRRLKNYLAEFDLEQHVHFLGLLSRSDQLDVLRCCAAVIQPSKFEGWSTVVEDTRAVGRRLYLSDIAVHKEQAPKNGCYFRTGSAQALAEAISHDWANLRPGPDLISEREAQASVDKLILRSAKIFCDIISYTIHSGDGFA